MLTVLRSDVDAIVATQVTAEDLAGLERDGYRYDLLAGDLIRVSAACRSSFAGFRDCVVRPVRCDPLSYLRAIMRGRL